MPVPQYPVPNDNKSTNPRLVWDDKPATYYHWMTADQSSVKDIAVENPVGWSFVANTLYPNQAGRIPASLHKDNGFLIDTGYSIFEAGYSQSHVLLPAGRYLLKVQHAPDTTLPQALYGKLSVSVPGQTTSFSTPWDLVAGTKDKLFVFHMDSPGYVNVGVTYKCGSEDNVSKILVNAITIEPVTSDYGGTAVAHVTPLPTTDVPPPPPATPPATPPDTTPPISQLPVTSNDLVVSVVISYAAKSSEEVLAILAQVRSTVATLK